MKKALLISGIVLVTLVAVLIAIPFIFRDALLEKTRTTINRNLNVDIAFAEFNLSLIRNFPKASLELKQLSVTGKGVFEKDTLMTVSSFRTSFGLLDLLTPDNLTINELIFDRPVLRLLVNASNEVNWQVFPETGSAASAPQTPEKTGSDAFGLQLSRIEIRDASVFYTDLTMPMQIDLISIDMMLDGRMYGADTRLRTSGTARQMNLVYDGVNYISKTRLGVNSVLDINFDTWKFVFSEGELLVNNLPLDVEGFFSMPDDTIHFDLGFASRASTLGEILALTPPDYEPYLKDLTATGNASFTGSFRGFYIGESYPDLQVQLRIAGGNARYAGMPEEIRNISGNLAIIKPQGDFNKTMVNISNAHFEIRDNPMDMNLHLSNLLEDLRFDGKMAGRLDFDHLKGALPLDSLDLAGQLDINLGIKGNYSAIEQKKYERLQTDGLVTLKNFVYNSPDLTLPVEVASGKMDFAPDKINLRQMDMKIGQSDMALSGTVTDYYPYIFSGGTLNGTLRINSNYLNINELMLLQASASVPETVTETKETGKRNKQDKKAAPVKDASTVTAFNVPELVSLTFQADVKRALYDRLNITNVNGVVVVNDGKLDLRGVNMNVMDGEMRLAGSYINPANSEPLVDMAVSMINFDIPTAFQSLSLVRKYLPIAQQSKGRFTTTINLKGKLTENMALQMPSINGSGLFSSTEVQVLNSPVFNKIKSVLNEERLREVRIDDFAANFTIENGNLVLRPFETRIAGQQAIFAGRLNVDNLINLQIGFLINRDALSKNIENTLGMLPGQKNIQVIPVGVTLNGPVKDPEFKIDLSDARELVKQEVKNASKEEIQKTINRLGDGLRKLLR